MTEIKNPYTDDFKALWWDRYNHTPKWCTLEDLQLIYNANSITEEDFITITGIEPQPKEPTEVDKIIVLEEKVKQLEAEILSLKS